MSQTPDAGPPRGVRSGRDLDAALTTFVEASGAVMALLLDRSGRALAHYGFRDREQVMDAATLAAGIHASGGRMGRMLGDEGRAEVVDMGATRQMVLREIRAPLGVLLLLTVYPHSAEQVSIRPAYAVFERAVDRLPELGGEGGGRPEDLESSLLRSLNRLFAPASAAGREGDPHHE